MTIDDKKLTQLTVWKSLAETVGVWLTCYEFKKITYQEWCEREARRFKKWEIKTQIRKYKKEMKTCISLWVGKKEENKKCQIKGV